MEAPSNQQQSASSTPDDAILAKDSLQSTSSLIFEDSYRSIHQIIRDNVSKLPFLDSGANQNSNNDDDDDGDDKKVATTNTTTTKNSNQKNKQLSGEEKMNRFIFNVYDKFMDSAQLYVEHELLTIDERQFSKKKRERLLRAFHQELEKETTNGNAKTNENNKSQSGINVDTSSQTPSKSTNEAMAEPKSESRSLFDLPSSLEQMPSTDQIKNLDDEITTLRQKMHQIKLQNNNLQSQLKSINQTKDISNNVQQVVQSSLGSYQGNEDRGEKLQDALNAAMIGKNGLEESCKDGRVIIQKLDEIKKARDECQNNDDNHGGRTKDETKEFGEEMNAAFDAARERKDMDSRPCKKLTLEEDYQERLKSGTMKNGPKVFSNLLK